MSAPARRDPIVRQGHDPVPGRHALYYSHTEWLDRAEWLVCLCLRRSCYARVLVDRQVVVDAAAAVLPNPGRVEAPSPAP